MILIIDNYDSFTYNLADLIQCCTNEPVVVYKNNQLNYATVSALKPSAIILSPGPGSPNEAGYTLEAILDFGRYIPILGVCLGHQSIAAAYGASILRVDCLMHGQIDRIKTTDSLLFSKLRPTLEGTRYHSLVVGQMDLPPVLKITATSLTDGAVMAIEHVAHPVFGLQFHPESFGTPCGKTIISNFLAVVDAFKTGGFVHE